MKWENIQIGNKIYEMVVNCQNPEIIDQIIHLDKEDALQTLKHLNSLFMNAIVNKEIELNNRIADTDYLYGQVIYHNQKLKKITSQLRSESGTQYWRDVKLNSILTNGV